MFRVIEQSCQGKQDDALCEDGIIVSPPFAAVVDGATSKGYYNWGEKTSGQIARDLIIDCIYNLSPSCTLIEALSYLTNTINNYTKTITGQQAKDIEACNRLTASVVIYSDIYKEVWQIGDCPFMVDGVLYDNSKPEEAVLAARRASLLYKALKKGVSSRELMQNDIGRKAILYTLRAECRSQNKKFSVVDGTEIYQAGIRGISVSNCNELILASDGYPFLCPTLAESEAALKNLLKEDPLCIHLYKATKGLRPNFHSFDDRSYLRIKL